MGRWYANWTCGICGEEWEQAVREPEVGESVESTVQCPSCGDESVVEITNQLSVKGGAS